MKLSNAIPIYLTDGRLWVLFWPLLTTAILLALILSLFVKNEKRDVFVSTVAFSMLGVVTGYITGLSREPAVHAVLPAVLSLFGGLAVFMIGKDKSSRTLVGFCTFAFAVTLILGIQWGGTMRWHTEQYLLSREYLEALAKAEALKKELGLK